MPSAQRKTKEAISWILKDDANIDTLAKRLHKPISKIRNMLQDPEFREKMLQMDMDYMTLNNEMLRLKK